MLLLAAGCSTSATGDALRSPHAQEDPAVYFDRIMSREHGPFARHPVVLLGGVIEGQAEAHAPPEVECNSADEGFSCSVILGLGQDDEGEEQNISCFIATGLSPFGPFIKAAQGPAELIEPPALTVEQHGEGIATTFVANAGIETDEGLELGTIKLSTLYAQGYMATCVDGKTGGRQTFSRVVNDFFDSLRFGTRPSDPTVFSMAYRIREGNRTTGFRYGFVTTDDKSEPRFTEHEVQFSLHTTEKMWTIEDHAHTVTRRPNGEVERYQQAFWPDGQNPLLISAKPSEDGRFRIKAEVGQRSDAIELTPKAALDTELWAAAHLGRLATNETSEYVYAWPTIDDGDPSLGYVVLRPSGPGVVVEQLRKHGRFDEDAGSDDNAPDELHVDAQGLVSKEVTSVALYERLFTRGQLPGASAQNTAIAVADPSLPPAGGAR